MLIVPTRTLMGLLLFLAFVLGATSSPLASPGVPATDVGGEIAPGTVWTRAGSPYEVSANVVVPVSVTLTIEPGVVVKMGFYNDLTVHGALQAVGTADEPITFERAIDEPWGTIEIASDSAPSTIGHAVLRGGGGGQRALITIATDLAVVHNADLTNSDGRGIDVTQGASPTVHDCRFRQVTSGSALPPAALRLQGPSNAVVTDNFFQSNHWAVTWDADASPTFTGNRFDLNGYNGVRISGRVSRAVELRSLGSRAWSYWVYGTGLDIAPEGTLTVGAGTTMRFASGASLKVRGTLRVEGTAGAKVLLSDERDHVPGRWREVRFEEDSVDYDPETGEGSTIDHAIIEYGGATHTGSLYVLDSSPRLTNTVVRHSASIGVGVRGADARPVIVGLEVHDNLHDERGIGLEIQGGAQPDVSFARIHDNGVGVRILDAASPRFGPHNTIGGSRTYGVYNEDTDVCVDASGNDWSASNGPLDQSPSPDACDQEDHLGNGELVSDNVQYAPFEGQLQTPFLESPRCGTKSAASLEISGFAPPDALQVAVFDNHAEIGRSDVEPSADGPPRFTYIARGLASGSHVLQVQSVSGENASGLSAPRDVVVDPGALVDASSLTVSYDLDGTRFVQPFVNDDGCATLRNDYGWRVQPLVGASVTMAATIACPSGATPTATVDYLDGTHPMSEAPDGRMQVTLEPRDGGPFGINVTCSGSTVTLRPGSISPSTQGFVHDEIEGVLARVHGAKVTLLVKTPGSDAFVRWDGAAYHGQLNPQITSVAGWYAFYPPPGTYKVRVEAEEYITFESAVLEVIDEPVMFPVSLRPLIVGRAFLPALQLHGG